MLWLVRPARPLNAEGAPSAVVLKARLGGCTIDEAADEWDPVSLIPPRIPAFTWRSWRSYEANGWNPLDPQPGETLSPEETRMISELLSDKEYELMILGAQIALQEESQEAGGIFLQREKMPTGEAPKESEVKALAAQGVKPPEIAARLGRPLPVVLKELGG